MMMMKPWQVLGAVGAMALALAACGPQASQPQPASPSASASEPASPSPPASSPLAKVKLGMTYQQVNEAIGAPTSQNSYMTGKAFVPFYFGNDVRRTSYYYKGRGRVVFAAGNAFGGGSNGEVIRVDYDPSEDGQPPVE